MSDKAKVVETREEIGPDVTDVALKQLIQEFEGRGAKCKVIKEGGKRVLVCRYEKKPRKKAAAGEN